MKARHSAACDCAPCVRHAMNRTLYLGTVFAVLAIFGVIAVVKAGLFAWVTN